MNVRFSATLVVTLLLSPMIRADGFLLTLEDNKIIGKNNAGIVPDELFGEELATVNNVDGTFETVHGGVQAIDPPFNSNDSFVYNIQGLWTYDEGAAHLASPGVILRLLDALSPTSDELSQINGQAATPQHFGIAATDTHELVFSVPQTSTADVLGLVFTVSGAPASGPAYEESGPLVTVHWTPNFSGDEDIAMQAIYAAAIHGDNDGDGTVNAADYVAWRKNAGTSFEYDRWRLNFGLSMPAQVNAAVPEPAAVAILIGMGAAISMHRPRRFTRRGLTR